MIRQKLGEREVMDYQQLITFMMEMVGTVAFAASGAMVAVDRAMDIFGVIVLGVTTAVGGGAVRDVILGIVPPAMFQHPVYTIVAMITSCIVFTILYLKKELLQGHNRETYDKVMLVMDSIGLGIFTVVGVNHRNFSWLHGIYVPSGVPWYRHRSRGGLLRDVMAGVPPYILVRHIYACASIVGAIVCVILYRHSGAVAAMVGASAVVVLIRYLAAHYRWNLPKLTREE